MDLFRRISVVVLSLFALSFSASSRSAEPKAAEDMGRHLRELFITTTAAKAGASANAKFPRVFAVAMDWPIDEHMATVVSMSDGNASLYTTSTFGIIGGGEHASVRKVAQRFVALANKHSEHATATSTYPYPSPGKVRFYFLTYDGVRTIETEFEPIRAGSSEFYTLFDAGQDVLTALRLITEKKTK